MFMFKKSLFVLGLILGSSVFAADWNKEYVRDDFGGLTKKYYLVHKADGKDDYNMLFSKGGLVVQINARKNIYSSSFLSEKIIVIDSAGQKYSVNATLIIDTDTQKIYSILINERNKKLVDLMREHDELTFDLGKYGTYTAPFHDFAKVHDEAIKNKFIDKK